MTIRDKTLANEGNFNDSFLSRKDDDSTAGKLSLANTDLESGAAVVNTQRAINKLLDSTGIDSESDDDSNNYADPKYIADGDSYKEAIEKLDAQLFTTDSHEGRLTSAEGTILDHTDTLADHEDRILELEDDVLQIQEGAMTIGGDKTFSDDVVIQGNLTVQGTMTSINTTNMEVSDNNIVLNKGGNDLTGEGAGITVERTSVSGIIEFDDDIPSKWKLGVAGALKEIIVSGLDQIIQGVKTFANGLLTDTIDEKTAAAGVTVDGVLLKDGLVSGRNVATDGSVQDGHIADATIHFTEASINHENIQNIGTNSHAAIDSHIASTSNPHAVTKTQVGLSDVTNDAQLKRAAADIDSFAEKSAINVDDLFLIEDAEDSLAKKKIKASALMSTGGADTFIIEFKMNGFYSQAGASNVHDGFAVVPFDCILKDVIAYRHAAGTSGSTTFDVRRGLQSGGGFSTIFTTKPSISYTAGPTRWAGIGDVETGITSPVLTTPNLLFVAKTAIVCDLSAVEGGSPTNAGVILVFEKVS